MLPRYRLLHASQQRRWKPSSGANDRPTARSDLQTLTQPPKPTESASSTEAGPDSENPSANGSLDLNLTFMAFNRAEASLMG
jgi:hypothetical protein